MSLTVHFIDENFVLQSKCLQTLEVPQDHNAVSLKDVLSATYVYKLENQEGLWRYH